MLEPWGPSFPPCREISKNESISEERGKGGVGGGSREGRGREREVSRSEDTISAFA